ncbi:type II toxin-antitoxin system RelE/ParE family toxin [Methylobacterium sp. J-076]|uniref:type II toxin-antitoxin system RelE/ParE family toxin n=1 Tax=Methylobacterium sp. J-076 TaxID=2836655 RepID=UPI001FB95FBB|nr:type II toxin-antitoxin system RelE/ParE family toxin [Methylobacterium sp. J-076]MCJ2011974.1 type II toxin-antitoxin system RelE/ParE family toxin [Methylobacterium sp. J-076]
MKVVVTAEAELDLERIGDFIARDNPARAQTFVTELVECCLRLSDTPRAFPLVARYAHTGVRRRVFGSYLIFYRVDEEAGRIDVLHVLNGAREYEAILSTDAP